VPADDVVGGVVRGVDDEADGDEGEGDEEPVGRAEDVLLVGGEVVDVVSLLSLPPLHPVASANTAATAPTSAGTRAGVEGPRSMTSVLSVPPSV
jgi:hypothetical protein